MKNRFFNAETDMIFMPQPKHIDIQNATFKNNSVEICIPEDWTRLRRHMVDYKGSLKFEQSIDLELNDEYCINADSGAITIAARSERAAYYACCTLKQLDADFTGEIHDWG